MYFIFLENYLHTFYFLFSYCSWDSTYPNVCLIDGALFWRGFDSILLFFIVFNSGERIWWIQLTFGSGYFCSGCGVGAYFRTDQRRSRPGARSHCLPGRRWQCFRVCGKGAAAGAGEGGKGPSDGEGPRQGRHSGWPAPVQHKAGQSGESKSFCGRGKSRKLSQFSYSFPNSQKYWIEAYLWLYRTSSGCPYEFAEIITSIFS